MHGVSGVRGGKVQGDARDDGVHGLRRREIPDDNGRQRMRVVSGEHAELSGRQLVGGGVCATLPRGDVGHVGRYWGMHGVSDREELAARYLVGDGVHLAMSGGTERGERRRVHAVWGWEVQVQRWKPAVHAMFWWVVLGYGRGCVLCDVSGVRPD